MVLTAAQQVTFFTNADRIGLSDDAHTLLIDEGIGEAHLLTNCTKDFSDNFFNEMQKPKLVEITPAANGNPAVFQSQPRPRINAYSQDRLQRASIAVKYYELVNRPLQLTLLTNAMIDIIYEHVVRLKAVSSTDAEHPVPVMGTGSSIQKFLQAFQQFLKVKIRPMSIPVKLAWIIREDVNIPVPGPLVPHRPWSCEHTASPTRQTRGDAQGGREVGRNSC